MWNRRLGRCGQGEQSHRKQERGLNFSRPHVGQGPNRADACLTGGRMILSSLNARPTVLLVRYGTAARTRLYNRNCCTYVAALVDGRDLMTGDEWRLDCAI